MDEEEEVPIDKRSLDPLAGTLLVDLAVALLVVAVGTEIVIGLGTLLEPTHFFKSYFVLMKFSIFS